MHRDLKAHIISHRAHNEREQQKFFDQFRRIYNVERPHEGIVKIGQPATFALRPDRTRASPVSRSTRGTGRSER
jgi:hypothetical protein